MCAFDSQVQLIHHHPGGVATGKNRVAEKGGFEPPVQFPVRQFSKLVVSATHPPLQFRPKFNLGVQN